MKAQRFHEYGTPDVLHLEEVPVPVPGAGQVRVAVAGTSFNGVDANIRAGAMQGPMPLTLPHVPGLDLAGTVDALGEGVEGLEVGDRVVGFLPFVVDGAAAEHVVVDAADLTAAPTSIPLGDAAALPLVGLTAWQALHEHANLTAGQRILVTGAGGAVGGYAVQLANEVGAHVIATTGPASRERALAAGAHEVLEADPAAVRSALTEPVDVLLNLAPITPEELAELTALVRDGGVVVSTTVWMPTAGDGTRGVRGIGMYVRSDAGQLAGLVDRVDRGALAVEVTERVALDELPSVHRRAAEGGLSGKVVVLVAGD